MTIARLDAEMAERENRSLRHVAAAIWSAAEAAGRWSPLRRPRRRSRRTRPCRSRRARRATPPDQFPIDPHICLHIPREASKRAGLKHVDLLISCSSELNSREARQLTCDWASPS